MDLVQGLLLITSIHLLAAASPGPDFVLVSQQTLLNGRKAGLMCSLGIALGLSIHIVYSIFGLALIIANSSYALWLIKVMGGTYLIYLGLKGLKARPGNGAVADGHDTQKLTAIRSVGLGFVCNALNPKAPVYFLSLFTLVLSPDMPLYQLAIYGGWMMVIQLLWFSIVVALLSKPVISQKFKSLGHWLDRALGAAMVVLGVRIIFSKVN